MKTYFVRHTAQIDIDDETRSRLWTEHRVAIHYPHNNKGELEQEDTTSLNPDDYPDIAKRYMTALVELAQEGGYVCTEHYPHSEWMIGLVRPESKIELLNGKWGNQNELDGRIAILKSLRLSNVKLVQPLDYAVLSVGRPRQVAILRWHLAGKTVENLVEGLQRQPQLSDLAPSQQEILCSEFLRLPQAESVGLPRLTHLLLPTGHTMRDIDIIGLAADSKRLLVQVTFSRLENCQWKLNKLLPYLDPSSAHLLFFCDCEAQAQLDGIRVFPIQQVYDMFTSTPDGKEWLRRSA